MKGYHTSGHKGVQVPHLNNLEHDREEASHEPEAALVRRIEALDVYDSERLNLILVWKRLVPTANFIISARNPPRSPNEQEALSRQVETLFTDLGLKFKEKTDYPGHENGVRFYQVAGSDEVLNEFVHFDFSDKKNAERIGLLFGVPPTAAHAYAKGPQYLIRDEDIPSKIRKQDYMAFSKFWFSKENWQEELGTLIKWADEIKAIDPGLYKRLVQYHKLFPFSLFKTGHIKTEDVPPTHGLEYRS